MGYWIRSSLDPFVEFPEVGDEAYCSILLGYEKCRGCPSGKIYSFQHS